MEMLKVRMYCHIPRSNSVISNVSHISECARWAVLKRYPPISNIILYPLANGKNSAY